MKYLDEMTNEELTNLAKENKIFLGLFFNRKRIMKKLIELGYELAPVEEKEDGIRQMELIDFSEIPVYRDRSKTFYRNFVNKKLMRKIKKKYRPNRYRFKEIDFTLGDLIEQEKIRLMETEINKSKFDKGQERDIYFDREFLPERYYVDEVVLMPKNPTTLYAYWEIREETFKKLQETNGVTSNLVLKIFKDGQEYRKIVRWERQGSHFITDVDANENYEAHIGYEDADGNFIEIAVSSVAEAPNDKHSDNFDLTWGTVKIDQNTNQVIKYRNVFGNIETLAEYENRLESLGIDEWDEDRKTLFLEDEMVEKLREVGSSEVTTIISSRKTEKSARVFGGSSEKVR